MRPQKKKGTKSKGFRTHNSKSPKFRENLRRELVEEEEKEKSRKKESSCKYLSVSELLDKEG